jgi:hypothetical protein
MAFTGKNATGVTESFKSTTDGSDKVPHKILDASEAHIGQIGGHTAVVDVTLSTDTSAYAAGEVVADSQIVNGALRKTDGTGVVVSVVLDDKDDQGAALTLYFLSSNVAMGTENAAPSISDANSATILGFVEVNVSDYRDLGGAKVAFVNCNIPIVAVSGTDDIYLAAVNGSGAATYTASGLVARLGILRD